MDSSTTQEEEGGHTLLCLLPPCSGAVMSLPPSVGVVSLSISLWISVSDVLYFLFVRIIIRLKISSQLY